MSQMIASSLAQIQATKALAEARARALKLLIEQGDEGRKARAREVIQTHQILWVREDDPTGGPVHSVGGLGISGLVQGRDAKDQYQVHLEIKLTSGDESLSGMRVRHQSCTCVDHGKAGPCKHVLAVAGTVFMEIRRDWNKLREAEKQLQTSG